MAHEMDLTDAELMQREEAEFYKPLPKAPFPAPPPFWMHFTSANIERLRDFELNSSDTPLPYELLLLKPPPPPSPSQTSYLTFDKPNPIDTTPQLPSAETLLFNPTDPKLNHADLLTRLTKSLLLNFLEFTTILADSPTERAEKLDDIQRLVKNVIAVINLYRPHQARESVREMLEGMLDDGRNEMEECERLKLEVNAFLESVQAYERIDAKAKANGVPVLTKIELDEREDSEQLQEARRLWRVVHEIAEE